MLTFGNNIAALQATRHFGRASLSLFQSYERLSSGLRITRASDDAAGLAIADSLRTDARLSVAAIRNANDGISSLQITDGALEQQANILFRMAELSEQAANGSLTNTQRQTLSREWRELVGEFSRIASTTTFNGRSLLLNGRDRTNSGEGPLVTSLSLQTGIDGSNNSQLSLSGIDTGVFTGTVSHSSLFAEGIVNSYYEEEFFSEFGRAAAPIYLTDQLGVNHDVVMILLNAGSGGGQTTIQPKFYERVSSGNGVRYNLLTALTAQNLFTYDDVTGDFLATNGLNDESDSYVTISFGASNSIEYYLDLKALKVKNVDSRQNSAINLSGLETRSRALTALDVTRTRLGELASIRGTLGSMLSRIGVGIAVRTVSQVNLSAAESQIRDADVSFESALFAANQIRQRVAASVLSQANLQPGIALSLLARR